MTKTQKSSVKSFRIIDAKPLRNFDLALVEYCVELGNRIYLVIDGKLYYADKKKNEKWLDVCVAKYGVPEYIKCRDGVISCW